MSTIYQLHMHRRPDADEEAILDYHNLEQHLLSTTSEEDIENAIDKYIHELDMDYTYLSKTTINMDIEEAMSIVKCISKETLSKSYNGESVFPLSVHY